MATLTKIQWTDSTFNPWRGCTKVSAGCAHCYAEAGSKRNPKVLGEWGPSGTRVLASEARWDEPWGWNNKSGQEGTTHRVFCASLADVFEDHAGQMVNHRGERLWWHPTDADQKPYTPADKAGHLPGNPHGEFRPYTLAEARARLWRKIAATPYLTWQLLTKRPENVARMVPDGWLLGWPKNVWLGTSVENQEAADERIPHLLNVPAAVRFLSCEPLLGPVDLEATALHDGCDHMGADCVARRRLHWVIIGGESGPHARPCDVAWVRSLVRQCKAAGVACFVKQLGADVVDLNHADVDSGWPPDARFALITALLRDPKGGDPDEWPEDLRVREFPRGVA